MSKFSPETHRTADGYEFKVIEDRLADTIISVNIDNNWVIATVDNRGKCIDAPGLSIVEKSTVIKRYFNVYRSVNGGVTFGKRNYTTNHERTCTRDSQRALFGLEVVINADTDELVSASQV